MYLRIIAAIALSFVFYLGSSQESYHRLYETSLTDSTGMIDTLFFHMGSTTLTGEVYAVGTKRVYENETDFEDFSVIFTKHDEKGDIDWSRELDLGKDSVEIIGLADIAFNGTEDSLLFTIEVEINDNRTHLFGRMSTGGQVLDLKTVGGYAIAPINYPPASAPFINETEILLTPSIGPTISRIGIGDSLVWSRNYQFLDSNDGPALSFVTDINTTLDSTIILSGFGDGTGDAFVVAELDSNGVQLWAESYTFSIGGLTSIYPSEVIRLSNGDFAVAGFYTTIPDMQNNGFVAVIDTAGSILIAKKLYITENQTTVGNIIEGTDGTLWVSGIYDTPDSSHYFTTNLNTDGTVNWTTVYPEQEAGFDIFTMSLLNVQSTGGATLVGHGFIDDLDVLRVMKHDALGVAMCSDMDSIFMEDLIVEDDTLTTTVINGGIFFEPFEHELNNFNGFSPPTLTVQRQDLEFCMNEFVDTILVASVGGVAEENITYEWSTGEFNDTLRVMEPPMAEASMYVVTVTITEDVCYMMCDTVQIMRTPLPSVEIGIDETPYCENRFYRLNASYKEGAANPTYLWSTGETTQSIEITQDGQYSVTVTDDCNEQASAAVDITDFPDVLGAQIEVDDTFDTFCEEDGSYELNASRLGGLSPYTYLWSTGEDSLAIYVNVDDTYSVTITDACGDTAVFSEEVTIDKEIPTSGEITFELQCDEENNALSRIIFNATTNVENIENANVELDVFDLEALEEKSSNVIPSNPLVLGSYLAELKICDGEVLASLTINAEALCGGLLQYPIAFFPGGQDEASQTFGPIPNDTMNVQSLISNVEFKVFNRWGETVFESNDILDAWDGSHKGDPAPSEVYIWYVSYILEGVEIIDKGDVTLIR